MKKQAYIDSWTRKTIALWIVISMLFPVLAAAQSQLKPVLLSEEQEFLNHLQENIQQVLDSPNWHVDGDDLVLDLNKNKNGKQRRFVLIGKNGSKEKLELFVQEKILGKRVYERPGYKRWIFDPKLDRWEYQFKKLPLGLANYSISPTGYKPYVTSETLEEYLSKGAVPYQTDDGKVYDEKGGYVLTPLAIEQAKRKEIEDRYNKAVMQCSVVVEKDDIRERDLVKKVFNVGKFPHTFSQAELEAFEDQIEIGKLEPNSLKKISDRVLNISLHATITTWLAFYEVFKGKKTKEEWLQYFYNDDYYSTWFTNLPQFKNAVPRIIDRYKSNVAKTSLHLLTEEELKLAISSFNHQIRNINQSCKNAKEELMHNTDIAPNKPMFSTRGMAQFADKMHRETSEKYAPIVEPFFRKIKSSELSILFGSEDFRDGIGEFDIEDCVQSGEGINETDYEKVQEAIVDIEKMYRQKFIEIIFGFDDAFKATLVQKYINSLPVSVQLALKQTKSAHEVKVVCGLIDDIYENDYFSKKVDQGLLGIGIIAAAMCGYAELGIPATFVVMSPINAAVALRGWDKWNEGVTLEKQVSQAMITGEIEQETAFNDLKKHESRQTEGLWDFFGTIGGEGVGYVGGYVAKQTIRQGTRAIQYFKQAKISSIQKFFHDLRYSKTIAAQKFFAEQDAKVLSDIEHIIFQPKYSEKMREDAVAALEKARLKDDFQGVNWHLENLGFDAQDAKIMVDRIISLEIEKDIFESISDILTKPENIRRQQKTLIALKKISVAPNRIEAMRSGRLELIELNYYDSEIDEIFKRLFDQRVGTLSTARGRIRSTIGYPEARIREITKPIISPTHVEPFEPIYLYWMPMNGLDDSVLRPGLLSLRNQSIRTNPSLSSYHINKAAHDVQEVLNSYPVVMDQDKAIEVLDHAHRSGLSIIGEDGVMVPTIEKKRALVMARQKLKDMGYNRMHPNNNNDSYYTDADYMIDRLADNNVRMLGRPEITGTPFVHHYTALGSFRKEIDKFRNGGILIFKDGKEFRIKGVYDNTGANNAILELDDGRLLRVPKAKRDVYMDKPSIFVRAQKYLESKGIPVVKVFEHGNDYVVVEKLTNRYGISNYMDYLSARSDLPDEVAKKMDDDLLKFAEKTSRLEYIGDFHPRQLVYSDEKGWVIVDFSEEVTTYSGHGDGTVFDRKFAQFLSPNVYRELIESVRKVRKSQ